MTQPLDVASMKEMASTASSIGISIVTDRVALSDSRVVFFGTDDVTADVIEVIDVSSSSLIGNETTTGDVLQKLMDVESLMVVRTTPGEATLLASASGSVFRRRCDVWREFRFRFRRRRSRPSRLASTDDADDDLLPALQEVLSHKKKRQSRNEGEQPIFYQSMKSVDFWEDVARPVR